MTSSRRAVLRWTSAAALGAAAVSLLRPFSQSGTSAAEAFEITKTDDEWKKLLTPEQFAVLRKQSTERPFTSPLEKEHRPGTFACAGCDLPVYDAATKFESGTGWPSFFDHLPDAVKTATDYGMVLPRTEVHCRRCGGHLGHVFDDGPKPTGLRYCMNGVAMTFHPATKSGT